MTMKKLIEEIVFYNDQLAFCPEDQGKINVFSFRKIKKYLLGTDHEIQTMPLNLYIDGTQIDNDIDLDLDMGI